MGTFGKLYSPFTSVVWFIILVESSEIKVTLAPINGYCDSESVTLPFTVWEICPQIGRLTKIKTINRYFIMSLCLDCKETNFYFSERCSHSSFVHSLI